MPLSWYSHHALVSLTIAKFIRLVLRQLLFCVYTTFEYLVQILFQVDKLCEHYSFPKLQLVTTQVVASLVTCSNLQKHLCCYFGEVDQLVIFHACSHQHPCLLQGFVIEVTITDLALFPDLCSVCCLHYVCRRPGWCHSTYDTCCHTHKNHFQYN